MLEQTSIRESERSKKQTIFKIQIEKHATFFSQYQAKKLRRMLH